VDRIRAWARRELPVESPFWPAGLRLDPMGCYEISTNPGQEPPGGCLSALDKQPGGPVLILAKNPVNKGFSAGYNTGMRIALLLEGVKYIAIVNNDTVVDPKCFSGLIDLLETRPEAGMATSKIYYYHEPERVWYGGGYLSWWKGGGVYIDRDKLEGAGFKSTQEPGKMSFLTGCFWVMRKSAVEKAGLLPEVYVIGGEESEYSLRMARSGFELWYHPGCALYHKVGRSYDLDVGRKLDKKRYDRGSGQFMYGSPRHMYNWYRYKLLFQKRTLSSIEYSIWYVAFRAYMMFSVVRPRASMRYAPRKVLQRVFSAALADHRRFNEITVQQLAAFEQVMRIG
jgi:GT2 family glycosyltransferase